MWERPADSAALHMGDGSKQEGFGFFFECNLHDAVDFDAEYVTAGSLRLHVAVIRTKNPLADGEWPGPGQTTSSKTTVRMDMAGQFGDFRTFEPSDMQAPADVDDVVDSWSFDSSVLTLQLSAEAVEGLAHDVATQVRGRMDPMSNKGAETRIAFYGAHAAQSRRPVFDLTVCPRRVAVPGIDDDGDAVCNDAGVAASAEAVGVCEGADLCPDTPFPSSMDPAFLGCSVAQLDELDEDRDGVCNDASAAASGSAVCSSVDGCACPCAPVGGCCAEDAARLTFFPPLLSVTLVRRRSF